MTEAETLALSLIKWLVDHAGDAAVLASVISDVLGPGDGTMLIEEASVLLGDVARAIEGIFTYDRVNAEIAALYAAADATIYAAEIAKFGPPKA